MGLFDGMKKAFENEKFDAPPEGIKATARHILVKTEDDATMVMDQIAEGSSSFADLAKQYSTCPSSAQGGSLGSFSPGTMVPEFDSVIFDPETQLGEVVGPVPTDVSVFLCGDLQKILQGLFSFLCSLIISIPPSNTVWISPYCS